MKIGVLIIGSLYWEEKPHRDKWRRERLCVESRQHVKVPIRYGRRFPFSRMFLHDGLFRQSQRGTIRTGDSCPVQVEGPYQRGRISLDCGEAPQKQTEWTAYRLTGGVLHSWRTQTAQFRTNCAKLGQSVSLANRATDSQ